MIEVKEERVAELEHKEETYEKFIEAIKDLLPEKAEEIEDLEGLVEELNWRLRCLEDEICKW